MAMLENKAVVITGSVAASARLVRRAWRTRAPRSWSTTSTPRLSTDRQRDPAAGGTAIACVADITDWDQAGR